MQQEISFSSDPEETARLLVRKNGLKRAQKIAVEGTALAHERGNLYRLSVWREVKAILSKRTDDAV